MKDNEMYLGLDEKSNLFLVEEQQIKTFASSSQMESENDDEEKINDTGQKNTPFWIINITFNNNWKQFYVGLQALTAFAGISGTLMGIMNSFSSMFGLFQCFFGRFSDRFGRKIALIIGFFTLTIASSILIFFANTVVIIIVAVAQALALALIRPVWNATPGDFAPKKTKATFLGKIAAITSIIDLIISTLLTLIFYFADSHTPIFGFFLKLINYGKQKLHLLLLL